MPAMDDEGGTIHAGSSGTGGVPPPGGGQGVPSKLGFGRNERYFSGVVAMIVKVLFKEVEDFSTTKENQTLDFSRKLNHGGDLNQINQQWSQARTLAKNAADNLDFSGSLTNKFGDTVSFGIIKVVAIHNTSTTVGDNLLIGGGATTFLLLKQVTGRYELGPDGVFFVMEPSLAGKTVTAGSADILRIENQGTQSIQYEIVVMGVQS